MPSEEARIKRILSNPSVEGVILTNEQGQLEYTSMDNNVTFLISSKLHFVASKARETVRDLDPGDDLVTLRIRTTSKEMMIVTPFDGIQVMAIQKITASSTKHNEQDDDFMENF